MSLQIAKAGISEPAARGRTAGMLLVLAGVVAGCAQKPAPRTFFDFMEDGIAREGVLARCNRDRDASYADIECANARRAAAAVALEQERARRAELERASERKLVALRAGAAADEAAEAPAQEVQAPSFGAPLGPVLPAIRESSIAYAQETLLPAVPELTAPELAPPASEIEIVAPDLVLEEVAIVPRPLRAGDAAPY